MADGIPVGKPSSGPRVELGGAADSNGNNAGRVIAEESTIIAQQIVPTIAGVSTGEIQVAAGGTAVIVGLRVTANPGDTVEAAQRLMDGFPDVAIMAAEDSIRLKSDVAITKVAIIGLGTVDNSGGYVAPVAKTLLPTNSTLANYETTLVEFDFGNDDGGNPCKSIEISLVPYSDGTTDGNLAQLSIAGYSA